MQKAPKRRMGADWMFVTIAPISYTGNRNNYPRKLSDQRIKLEKKFNKAAVMNSLTLKGRF